MIFRSKGKLIQMALCLSVCTLSSRYLDPTSKATTSLLSELRELALHSVTLRLNRQNKVVVVSALCGYCVLRTVPDQ